jgi:NADH dehydrogenase
VRASPAGKWLQAETDAAGRVRVEPDLSVPGHKNVFAIGDTAHVRGEGGRPLPGVAPVAKQQGLYVARLLANRVQGRSCPPFRYKDPGAMATIGRNCAVAEINGVRASGFAAWLLWSCVHIYFLIGFRSRLSVALSWAWNYVTSERGARLITGPDDVVEPAPAALKREAARDMAA